MLPALSSQPQPAADSAELSATGAASEGVEPWLPVGRVVGFDVAGRVEVACLAGEVWLTGPGTGDRILSGGESTQVVGRGRIVVQALRPSLVHLAGREGVAS